MNMRPAVFLQISSEAQQSKIGFSGAISTSQPILPLVEEKYPKLPGTFHVSSKHKQTTNPLSSMTIPSASKSLISSPSGSQTDYQFTHVSPQESRSHSYPFISNSSMIGPSFAASQTSHLCVQSATLDNYPIRSNVDSWDNDAFHEFLDHKTNVPVQNGQVETLAGVMSSDDYAKRKDWQEWADQLINDDDTLDPNWNDIFVDVNILDPEPKVCLSTLIAAWYMRTEK